MQNLQRLESMENMQLPPEIVQARIQAHSQPLTSPTSVFPMPFTLRNSRVPKTTINATRGFRSNGFVRPQGPRNSTLNTRRRVFEDNFIRRIIQMVEDAMVRDIPINFQRYTERLLAPDCSRDEAILLYNELIAIFIILILYIVYVLKDTMEKLQVNPSLNPSKMILSFDKIHFFSNLKKYFLKFIFLHPVGFIPTAVTTLMLAGTAFPVFYVFLTLALVSMISYLVVELKLSKNHELIYNKEKTNLLSVIQNLVNILLDNRNTVQIALVKDELKYWGLTKAQVDYLLIPNNNDYRDTLIDTAEFPPIGTAQELGINENERQALVDAREASIELQRRTNEEFRQYGYTVFNIDHIKEFILKAGENKEVLAPNGLFSNSLVKFGKRNNVNRGGATSLLVNATAGTRGGKKRGRKTNKRKLRR